MKLRGGHVPPLFFVNNRFFPDPTKLSLQRVRWDGRENEDLADGEEFTSADEELELVLHPAGFEMFRLERK